MFLRKKLYKNQDGSVREYLQVVESRRINGKPRQIVVLSLGQADAEEAQSRAAEIIRVLLESNSKFTTLNVEDEMKAEWSKTYGLFLIWF